jgi:branched-chain amino acid transport system permease protein
MKSKIYFLSTVLAIFLVNLVKDSIDPYYYTILIYIGINIILASSLNLINGFTGQFSLGHAGFMAIGAYLSIALSTYFAPFFNNLFGMGVFGENMTFLTVMIIGGLASAVIGLIVGVPSLRLKGDYLAIVTLGFSEIIRVLIQGMDVIGASQGYRGVYQYSNGVKSLQMLDNTQDSFIFYGVPKYTNFFWTFFVAAFIVYFIYNLINTTKFKVIAFVSGAFFAGVAGSLYGHFNLYLNPEDFNFLKSVEIVAIVILGGMGSIPGVIIAAVILTILPELLRGISEYRMIVYALLLIVMMLTRPQGLFGVKFKFKRKKKVESS